MICSYTNREANHCTGPKNVDWYRKGCRCEAARKLNADHTRPYLRKRRGAMGAPATCPLCGSETYRPSGFCRGCEGKR